ncbi:MAG: hypothetical protein AAFN38_21950 [Cyanobacteria bacterium J06560_5]
MVGFENRCRCDVDEQRTGWVSNWTKRLGFALASAVLLQTPANALSPDSLDVDLLETATEEQVDDATAAQQERLRLYLQRLRDAAAERELNEATAVSGFSFPSLGSAVFDAQLAGYVAYLEMYGTPDVLIVGSSRALQGIDPEVMQAQLASQGYADMKVYNFSVNGATAQVVNFILAEVLPGELPGVVVWGDGSRAFNDGRRDRTWESLIASPGYQAIAQGERPPVPPVPQLPEIQVIESVEAVSDTAATTVTNGDEGLDSLGFSAVGDRFDPASYYRQFPRVSGRYDGAYAPFTLEGAQTVALGEAADYVRSQNSQLLFVNLPLSSSYLDEFRLYHEGQFQEFLAAQSDVHGFSVVDLLTQWDAQPGFFADPSHINLHGAAAIAHQLAQDPTLLVALTSPSVTPVTTDAPSTPQRARTLSELLESVDSAAPDASTF